MKIALSVVVAVVAIVLLFLWGGVDVGDVIAAARSIHPATFLTALAVQASIYVFRALRLRGLLVAAGGDAVPIRRLTAASAAWILDSHVLPAKVGEASLVLHLARVGVRKEHGLVGLLLSRLFDLATLLLVLGLACLAMGVSDARATLEWLIPLGLALLGGALVLVTVIVQGGAALGLVRRGLVRVGLERTMFGSRVSSFVVRVEDALHAVPRGALWVAAGWSVPVWAAVLGVYAILGTGVGLTGLSPFDVVFGSSLAILGSLVPINGFLGFGMLDMGWAWGFAAVGVPEADAVATGLAFHTLYLVGVGILGAIGHAGLTARTRESA